MAENKRSQDESRTKLSPLEIKNLAEKVTDWERTTGRHTSGGHAEVPGSEDVHYTITYFGKIDEIIIGAHYSDPGYSSWARLGRKPIELGWYTDRANVWGESEINGYEQAQIRETYEIAQRRYQEQEQVINKVEAELKAKQEAEKEEIIAGAVKIVRKIHRG